MVLKPIVSPVDVSEPFNIKTREFFLSGRPVFFSFIHSRCASNSLAGLLLSCAGCSTAVKGAVIPLGTRSSAAAPWTAGGTVEISFGGCSLVLADRPAFGEAGSAFFVAGPAPFCDAGGRGAACGRYNR